MLLPSWELIAVDVSLVFLFLLFFFLVVFITIFVIVVNRLLLLLNDADRIVSLLGGVKGDVLLHTLTPRNIMLLLVVITRTFTLV